MAGRIVRWTTKVLLWSVVAILVLLIIGAIYQAIATEIDQRRYPPPGELVEVGDHRLHIHCAGEGSPTVILESTSDGTSANWGWVQPEVAKSTRVCAYDRGGRGWSELGPQPRDAIQIAGELHALLRNADVPAPYVLVGHSAGGLFIREYAERYPNEVAGMVLLDAAHPVSTTIPSEREGLEFARGLFTITPWLAPFGIDRVLYGWGLIDIAAGLPPEQVGQIKAFWSVGKQHISSRDELAVRQSRTEPQVRRTGDLGDMPLMVISADKQPADWFELQKELATLSSESVHRVIDGSSHLSLAFDETDAQASSAAIVEVVEAVRNGQPLMQ
jgi:pimeloyl-ACP methyl ester carboxylesterase